MRKTKRAEIDRSEGRIFREGGAVVVERVGAASLKDLDGVECVNPDAPEAERIYRKTFVNKPVYLPDEYDRAVAERLSGTDVMVMGMNGYSLLTPEQCLAWGVKVGAYEAACRGIFSRAIRNLQREFQGIDVRIVHGASDLGVDKSAIQVGRMMNRPQLGFSCPKFMFYVLDDDIPVYVAGTQAEYAVAFIKSLDILISANGRKQAFEHDIDGAFKFKKHIIPINVLKSISTKGGPPAFNANGDVEDAVAAMEILVHMVSVQFGHNSRDRFKELCGHLDETLIVIARQTLSPDRAFGNV